MTTDTTPTGAPTSNDTDTTDVPAGGAEWFERIHLAQLHDNPNDVRGGDRDQATLVEMAASVRSAGVLQALTVIPVPNSPATSGQPEGEADELGQRLPQFVIYAGHRRRDGARLAAAQVIAEALGHDTAADPTLADFDADPDDPEVRIAAGVQACEAAERLRWLPCLVRPDLAATIGMDIAAGLIENDLRAAITGGQRTRAAEQLSMADGWDLTRIADATGLSRAHVRAAAALPRLGETTRQAAHRGEVSLEHVAILDQLAGQGATEEELGLLARSGSMFDHHVTELGKTLRRRTAAAALLDEADNHGWTRFTEPEGYPLDSPLAPAWSLTRTENPDAGKLLPREGEHADPTRDRTAAGYAAMPDHGVILINDPWADPRLEVVCADPDTWNYRRDPRSTLYVEPAPEPETEPATDDADADADAGPGEDHGPGDGRPDDTGTDELPEGVQCDRPGIDDEDQESSPPERDEESETAAAAAAEQARVEAEQREQERRAEAERREEARRIEAAERAAENERREAERVAAQARRDALETAAETRWRHTAGLLRTQKGAAAHAELPTVVLARFPGLLGEADYFATKDEVTAVCAAPERDPRTGTQRWSTGRQSHRAVAIAAWLLDQNLAVAVLLERALIDLEEAEPALWWLDYLTSHGYQPAKVETEARAMLDEIVTAGLAAEHSTEPETEAGADPDEVEPGDGLDPADDQA